MGRSTRGEKYSTTLQIKVAWVQGALLSSPRKWERYLLGRENPDETYSEASVLLNGTLLFTRDFPIHESLRCNFEGDVNVLIIPTSGNRTETQRCYIRLSRKHAWTESGESNLA